MGKQPESLNSEKRIVASPSMQASIGGQPSHVCIIFFCMNFNPLSFGSYICSSQG
jgi:hypothetical protein